VGWVGCNLQENWKRDAKCVVGWGYVRLLDTCIPTVQTLKKVVPSRDTYVRMYLSTLVDRYLFIVSQMACSVPGGDIST